MSTRSDQVVVLAGEPLPAGPEPRRPGANTFLGVLSALVLVGLGVVAVHDAVVGWGLVQRSAVHQVLLDVANGMRPDERTLAASILALIVGGVLVIVALRPRGHETYQLKSRTGVHIWRPDLARLLEDDLVAIAGVSWVRVRPRGRRLRVQLTTTGGSGITEQVQAVIDDRLADLVNPPRPAVQTLRQGSPARGGRKRKQPS